MNVKILKPSEIIQEADLLDIKGGTQVGLVDCDCDCWIGNSNTTSPPPEDPEEPEGPTEPVFPPQRLF